MRGQLWAGAYLLIAEEAWRLAKALPFPVVQAVIARLGRSDGTDWGTLRAEIARALPSPHYRSIVIGRPPRSVAFGGRQRLAAIRCRRTPHSRSCRKAVRRRPARFPGHQFLTRPSSWLLAATR